MTLPMFLGGVGQMMTIAANSAAPMISGLGSSLWGGGAMAAAEAAALPGIIPGAAANGFVSGTASLASPWAAGAGASAAGGGGGAAGGGALAALGPAAAVLAAGAAGFGAGWGGASLVDDYGATFGTDEHGHEMSAFDKTAQWGRGAESWVDGLVGDEDSTLGTVAGATVAGLSSIPMAAAGALGGMWDWMTD